ncbi:MAG: HPr family phosphocarrier protein, partial [Hyphomicrobiales bacterium]
VKCVERFDAAIMVSKDGENVIGTSIMGLLMLAAGPGSQIEVSASGPDASDALTALSALVAHGFHE